MTTHEPPRLRISSPGDVAQLVPYLIGFVPQDSLVLLVTRQGRVEVTARADIADVQPTGQAEHLIDRIWGRFPDADAFMVAYTDNRAHGWDLVERCRRHLPNGTEGHAMLVTGDTWHTEDGASGEVDRFGAVAAQATLAGMVATRSRTDLEATFTSPQHSEELEHAVEVAAAKLPDVADTAGVVKRTRTLIARYVPHDHSAPADHSPSRMPTDDAAQLALLGLNGAGRDTALLSITRADAEQHLELWSAVVRSVPDSYAEAATYLAGMAAWVTGDGAVANVALSRSLAIAEQTGAQALAGLLDGLIDQVVPPTAWEQVRDQALSLTRPEVRQAIQPATTPRWENVPPPTSGPAPVRPHRTQPPAAGIGI